MILITKCQSSSLSVSIYKSPYHRIFDTIHIRRKTFKELSDRRAYFELCHAVFVLTQSATDTGSSGRRRCLTNSFEFNFFAELIMPVDLLYCPRRGNAKREIKWKFQVASPLACISTVLAIKIYIQTYEEPWANISPSYEILDSAREVAEATARKGTK